MRRYCYVGSRRSIGTGIFARYLYAIIASRCDADATVGRAVVPEVAFAQGCSEQSAGAFANGAVCYDYTFGNRSWVNAQYKVGALHRTALFGGGAGANGIITNIGITM